MQALTDWDPLVSVILVHLGTPDVAACEDVARASAHPECHATVCLDMRRLFGEPQQQAWHQESGPGLLHPQPPHKYTYRYLKRHVSSLPNYLSPPITPFYGKL